MKTVTPAFRRGATAAVNSDGRIAVVICNARTSGLPMQRWVVGRATRGTLPAQGVITIVL